MKYFYLLLILFSYSFVNAQNWQSNNYTLQINDDFKQESLSTQIPNLTEISKSISQNFEISKNMMSEIKGVENENYNSLIFEKARNEAIETLLLKQSEIRQDIRKVDILEAAWLKMNNLNPRLNTKMFADIKEMKRILLNSDSEITRMIKFVKNLEITDSNFIPIEKSSIDFNFDDKKYKEIQTSINNEWTEYEKLNKTNKSSIPQISTINKKFNPTVSLLGAANLNIKGQYKLEIFVGNGAIDTFSTATILVPELSNYGIRLNGFKDLTKRFGINGDFHYHEKKSFNPHENVDFTFARIQSKLGIEYLVFKDILSVYGNVNFIIPVTNTEKYKEVFTKDNRDLRYYDLGLKLFVTPKGDLANTSGVGLFVDLNFISTTEMVKFYNGNSDAFIPNIKFGLQKNFR